MDHLISTAVRVSIVVLLLILLLAVVPAVADDASDATVAGSDFHASLLSFRENVDFRFRDRVLSPLNESDRAAFDGLRYFDPVPELAAPAVIEPSRDRSTFAMPTFDARTLDYSHYATVIATVEGRSIRLKAFRREDEAVMRDVLLIPFRDSTNSEETYPGGRYIEIDFPLPEPFVLDFNRAANPLCAYDARYACPIPPRENELDFPIRAGEKRFR